jgi:hypothetical protein
VCYLHNNNKTSSTLSLFYICSNVFPDWLLVDVISKLLKDISVQEILRLISHLLGFQLFGIKHCAHHRGGIRDSKLIITTNKPKRQPVVHPHFTYSHHLQKPAKCLTKVPHQIQGVFPQFSNLECYTQSASAYPCNLMSTLEAYLRPYPTVPRRYLNTCFVVIQ